MAVSAFMITMDNTVVANALPTMMRDLGMSNSAKDWVATGYILMFSCLMIAGGRLTDVYGCRLTFTSGMVIFTASSAVCGLAGDEAILILGRIVQGAGAALALPATLVMVTVGRTDKQRSIGTIVWVGAASGATALGPAIGGFIVQQWHWGWIFLINIVPGILVILLGLVVLTSKGENKNARVDLPGVLISATMLFALAYGLETGRKHGWTDPSVLSVFALAAIALACFVVVETWAPDPMMNLRFFRNRVFVGGLLSQMLWGIGFNGMIFYSATFLQRYLDFSPPQAGLVMMPPAIAIMVLTPLGFWLAAKLGPRPIIGGGMAAMAAGMVMFSALHRGDGFADLMPGVMIVGIGSALCMPLAMYVLKSVPEDQAGVASGILNVIREVSGAFGIAIVGLLIHEVPPENASTQSLEAFRNGTSNGLILGATLVLIGGLISGLTLPSKRGWLGPKHGKQSHRIPYPEPADPRATTPDPIPVLQANASNGHEDRLPVAPLAPPIELPQPKPEATPQAEPEPHTEPARAEPLLQTAQPTSHEEPTWQADAAPLTKPVPWTELEPQAEPAWRAEATPPAQSQPQAESEPQNEPTPHAEPELQAETVLQAEPPWQARPEPSAEPEPHDELARAEPLQEAAPIQTAQPTSHEEPTWQADAAPLAQPEPWTELEPQAEPAQAVEPTLQAEPTWRDEATPPAEPEPQSEPAPHAESEPWVEPAWWNEAPPATPELELEPQGEPAPQNEPAMHAEPQAEPVQRVEPVRQDEPVLQAEPAWRGKATAPAEPEPALHAEPEPQTESVLQDEPALQTEPTWRSEPEPAAEPELWAEPVLQGEPATYAEPQAEPAQRVEPVRQDEPVLQVQPTWHDEDAAPAEPERQGKPAQQAEPVLQAELTRLAEPAPGVEPRLGAEPEPWAVTAAEQPVAEPTLQAGPTELAEPTWRNEPVLQAEATWRGEATAPAEPEPALHAEAEPQTEPVLRDEPALQTEPEQPRYPATPRYPAKPRYSARQVVVGDHLAGSGDVWPPPPPEGWYQPYVPGDAVEPEDGERPRGDAW
ncbi:DHA2 family efflux MFS transporter permease subunit [Actinomadura sp. 6N118]|uniref:DHA2 family efflux MFS transporter permease subunit n=1 Tax=Actinomadura sp. 6N118 TaxID=3375151 RepID=UPI0037A11512